jgi:hypothetical protein
MKNTIFAEIRSGYREFPQGIAKIGFNNKNTIFALFADIIRKHPFFAKNLANYFLRL